MTSDGDHRPPPEPGPPGLGPQPAPPGHPDPLILDQAFDADSLYALRAAVAAHATQAGLAPGRTDDLVIVVHELAANAVRHGAGHGRLRVWKSDQALFCEISDDGIPQPAGTGDATQWRTEPGHGLSLVRQVADQASLRSGPSGTLATISFALDAPGPPFRLDRHPLDGCTVLTVTGPLDLSSAAQLTAAIGGLLAQAPADPRAPSDPRAQADPPAPAAPGPRPVRPVRLGFGRPGRPGHRAASDQRQPAREDGPGRAPAPPEPAPSRGRPGRPFHPGRQPRRCRPHPHLTRLKRPTRHTPNRWMWHRNGKSR